MPAATSVVRSSVLRDKFPENYARPVLSAVLRPFLRAAGSLETGRNEGGKAALRRIVGPTRRLGRTCGSGVQRGGRCIIPVRMITIYKKTAEITARRRG